MRRTTNLILAGAAALALAGGTAWAAGTSQIHHMTIRLPGGGVEQIQYTGNVKPDIQIVRAGAIADPFASAFFAPMPVFFGPSPTFVGFDQFAAQMARIDAQMQQQMHDMLRQVQAMQRLPAGAANAPLMASFGSMPAGSESYSMISVGNGGHMCTQMTEITRSSASAAPQVVQKSSGDCAASAHPSTPASAAPKSSI